MTEKQDERVWIDPPGVDPVEVNLEQDSIKKLKWDGFSQYPTEQIINMIRKWRLMFVGMMYIFTGGIMYIAPLLSIDLTDLKVIFMVVGVIFVVLSFLLYKKTGEMRPIWK